MKQTLLALLILFPILASAQPGLERQPGLSRNALYVEALGLGILYSLNYERQLYLSETLRIGMRIGFSPPIDGSAAVVPIAFHMLYGRGYFRLEGGLGASYQFSTSITTGPVFAPKWTLLRAPSLAGYLGFRYHPPVKGVIFRLGYQPFFNGFTETNGFIRQGFVHWVGISLGYALPYYRTQERDEDN